MFDSESKGGNGSLAPQQVDFESPDEGTVPLSGYLEGPFVHEGEDIENRDLFRLRQTRGAEDYLEVSWWNIRWIDAYPHAAYGEPDWNQPIDLDKRICWVNQDLRLDPGGFLAGQIAQDYLPEVDTTPFIEDWRREMERRVPRDGDNDVNMCSRPSCGCVTMPTYDNIRIPPELSPPPDIENSGRE